MVSFKSLLVACSAATAALALPVELEEFAARMSARMAAGMGNMTMRGTQTEAMQSTPTGTGTNNGFFYSFWTDGAGSVTYNNLDAGK